MSTKKEQSANWHLFDAKGQVLGRLATQIATLLQGKHKPTYIPHLYDGDYVIVINTKDITLTGNKEDQKLYHKFSGYPGGLKTLTYKQMKEKDPNQIIYRAVYGMLPKNKTRNEMLKKLKLFADKEHPHTDKIK